MLLTKYLKLAIGSFIILTLIVSCSGEVDRLQGIVKTDHPHEFFDGEFRYFPNRVFNEREDLHKSKSRWYSNYLKAMREPSLYKWDDNHTTTLYRFTWLRSFHRPISIRLEILPDGEGKLYSKILSGRGGYGPGELTTSRVISVSKDTVQEFIELLQEQIYWELPTNTESGAHDGARWIIEGRKDEKYHLVDRQSPRGRTRKIGLFLLKLSGIKIKEVY